MEFHYKILVVEDDDSLRCFINGMLEKNGYDVINAETGSDAEILASSHCPDLILLDLGLPDKDGMEVLSNIRKWSASPIIVVSSRQSEGSKVAALEDGADDYIEKPFGQNELMARVRVALRHVRSSGTNRSIAFNGRYTVGNLVIDYDKFKVYINGKDAELTQNEYKLVALLGQYAGRVLPYDFIIQKMWGPNVRGDNQILRVNMTNIRRKIEKDPSHPRYIFTETGIGYRMVEK